MRNKIYILMFMAATLFTACDSQLNEVSSKQQDIIPKHVSYLEAFLSNDDYKSVQMKPMLVMGDDYVPLKTLQDRDNRVYTKDELHLPMTWDIEELTQVLDPGGIWGKEYNKIYIANTILDYIPEVGGTEAEKKRLSGDAHLMRAFSHYLLTSTYGLPYNASNVDELGTCLIKKPSLQTIPERSTLEKCYEFILDDLKAAEEELADIDLAVAPVGNIEQWRASAPAVYGLMAKVYLTMGNYEQAQIYAQKALDNSGVAELMNFDTEMSYSNNFETYDDVREVEGDTITVEIKYPMTRNVDFEIYDWKESYFRQHVRMPQAWMVPSEELTAVYGADATERDYDLRWRYFFVENYSYKEKSFRGSGEGASFIPAEKICAYVGLNNIGPSVPEMYLIKAECQARGTAGIAAAQETINELRANRFDSETPANIRDLTFTSKDDAIKQILDERRREMPFFARWYDLKRIAANGEFSYIPTSIERDFYEVTAAAVGTAEKTYTFSPQADIRKFAYPIPKKDIVAAEKLGATITQNTY